MDKVVKFPVVAFSNRSVLDLSYRLILYCGTGLSPMLRIRLSETAFGSAVRIMSIDGLASVTVEIKNGMVAVLPVSGLRVMVTPTVKLLGVAASDTWEKASSATKEIINVRTMEVKNKFFIWGVYLVSQQLRF